jgi:taurine dioxygenase
MALASEIVVEKLAPHFAARITGIDWSKPVDKALLSEIHLAFAEYSVLCFPSQRLGSQDQQRFASCFGQVDGAFRQRSNGDVSRSKKRGVMLVSNIRKNGKPIGSLPDGEMFFHSDGSHRNKPYRATTLYGIKIPSVGGQTMFSDLRAAYDALSRDMKNRIENLKARHIYDYGSTLRDENKEIETNSDYPNALHPLVKTHPVSGRRTLYLSRLMTRWVEGLDRTESDELLEFLFDHAEQPEFIYSHKWTPDDLLIWDNRCLNHARTDFPKEETRLLRRYTVSEPGDDEAIDY